MNDFLTEYLTVLQKFAVFTGRARRKEYWSFALVNFLIMMVLMILTNIASFLGFLYTLYSLAVLVPSIAVSIRRLHDINKSGWWCLVGLVPIIGAIVLLVFAVKEGDSGPNQYGDDPKAMQY